MRTDPLEATIKAKLRLALGQDERVVLWNNPGGHAILSVRCPKCSACFPTQGNGIGERVRYGLREGAADVIGLTHKGRFVGFETKTRTGVQSAMQKLFANSVRQRNGFYALVRTPEEGMEALERALRGENG
jgi:hypothetical protein